MTNATPHSPYQRAGFLAWAIFIVGLITTIGLGTWQIQRLQWKEGLIEKIEIAKTKPPITDIPNDEASLKPLEFQRVQLTGRWMNNIEFHIAARYFQGTLGYHVLQPLRLAGGRIAIVNRGWIPAEQKEVADRTNWAPANGNTSLVAMVRVGSDRNRFTPENQPDQNIYFGRDVVQMAESEGLDIKQLIPASFDVIGDQTVEALPIPSSGEVRLRNDHLSYVLTWYLIAFFMVIIFWRYQRVTSNK